MTFLYMPTRILVCTKVFLILSSFFESVGKFYLPTIISNCLMYIIWNALKMWTFIIKCANFKETNINIMRRKINAWYCIFKKKIYTYMNFFNKNQWCSLINIWEGGLYIEKFLQTFTSMIDNNQSRSVCLC